jgi:DNA topoisomerase-2
MPVSKKNKASNKKVSKSKKLTIEEQYTHKNDHEHALHIPDTYIGGIEEDLHKMWVYNNETDKMELKNVNIVPGLYKIYDEIIVNARDHTIRDKSCNKIKVWIDQDNGEISCYNNGENGLDVALHEGLDESVTKGREMYVPEFVFSVMRASGNFDQKGKIVGGKNGYGATLCNIFSTHFYIEVVDARRNLKFTQSFRDNMYTREEPVVTKLKPGKKKIESYCLLKFTPDFNRFGIDHLTDDHVALFKKRVYDVAACTNNKTKVYLDDKLLNVSSFEDYINKFYEPESIPSKPIYEQFNDRWRIGVIYDPTSGYKHISYVNGICTFQGGSHVNHVVEQVVGGLNKFISDKHKNVNIKNAHIKDNLTFFIDSVITDPSFSSQSKEYMSSKVASFGSRCDITEDFIKEIAKSGIVDDVVNFAKLKAMAELKKTDGKKKAMLKGLAKLDDAHWAGTRKSTLCRLILTEGDSAKDFAVAGTDIVGRDKYGVFPLKGKLLNVREATAQQLIKNEEIKNIKQIMGLKHNHKYKNTNELRYGGIIVLTDQDVDGYHIKGLLMNFIHYFWPSLLKMEGFIQCIKTPIIKTWKKTDIKKKNFKVFYNLSDYNIWKKSVNFSLWRIKYYKGLGTSTEEEAKESFLDLEKKLITYVWDKDDDNDDEIKLIDNSNEVMDDDEIDINTEEDDNQSKDTNDSEDVFDKTNECYNALTLAFDKTRSNDRKGWLKKYDKDNIIEDKETKISYYDFVHKELIHFSNYDNIRSIPARDDGLKPSQRKILYCAFMRKILKDEIKVAQFVGFVSDKASYHHGEASLEGAIIGMAQNFVGSNNLNILTPNGNFGSRRMGGKNAASGRYIFTQLNSLVPLIFREEDEKIYELVNDDGQKVEPVRYAPIIPMVLINGCEGIGTGFSTNIPSFNPKDIFKNIKRMLDGQEPKYMQPWYNNFKGSIIKLNEKSFQSIGNYEIINKDTVVITELPVGVWTENYITTMNAFIPDDPKNPKKGQIIKSLQNDSGNNTVNITITFFAGELQKLIKTDSVEKSMKLTKPISISNMHLYDDQNVIKKYDTISDILKDYHQYRLEIYDRRKTYYVKILENDIDLLKWKIKFIKYVIQGKIIVFKNKQAKTKAEIINRLVELGFPKLSAKIVVNVNKLGKDNKDNEDLVDTEGLTEEENEDISKTYSYITTIPLFALTQEEIDKLEEKYQEKYDELDVYKNTPIETLWLNELEELEKAYAKWVIESNNNHKANSKKMNTAGKSKKGQYKAKPKAKPKVSTKGKAKTKKPLVVKTQA